MGNKHITLVVTGSVAAVKTFQLIEQLQNAGYELDIVVTKAVWEHKFFESPKYKPTDEQLDYLKKRAIAEDDEEKIQTALARSEKILVCPASADFISQIAQKTSPLGALLATADKPLFIAPAMNVMMWKHPAVVGNVAQLKNATFLGPVWGFQACGDQGYGRLADIDQIVSDFGSGEQALFEKAKIHDALLPQWTAAGVKNILLMVHHNQDDQAVKCAHALVDSGYNVQCMLAAEALDAAERLEAITDNPPIWEHYQRDPQGMEHIRLPEQSDVVVVAPTSDKYLSEMARGASRSLCGCAYLATKKPVIIVSKDSPRLSALKVHGATIVPDMQQLHSYLGNKMPISYQDNQRKLLAQIHSGELTDYRKSAVLLPLVLEDGEWNLLMTQRSSAIPYGGQITFPGGKTEGDETSEQTAFREGKEEINLDPKKVTVTDLKGMSVTQVKHNGILRTYTMEPVIGIIHDSTALSELKPADGEVERIVKIPLRSLLAASQAFQSGVANGLEAVEVDGVSQYQFVLPDPDQLDKTITIRNVTAGILVDFLSQFRDEKAMKDYLQGKIATLDGAKITTSDFSGKKILVIGGSPKEVIDGVRHYANYGRSEGHGAQVAQALEQLGAKVTLVTTKNHVIEPQYVEAISTAFNREAIMNSHDLISTAALEGVMQDFDAVINLANIGAVCPKTVSDKKLKVKKEEGSLVPMDVVGNVDVQRQLAYHFPKAKVIAGYNNQQQWFSTADTELAQALKTVVEQHASARTAPVASQAPQIIPTGGKLFGRKIIITSGPTAEPISPTGDVITNFSSGKQGHAIAEALAKMGAQITHVSGPTYLPDPTHPNIHTVHVDSAKAMRDAAMAALPADVFIGVAAVADFGMDQPPPLALREAEPHTLQLSQNPDILQSMGTHPSQRPSVVVGFAAETHDLLKYARGKLEKKGADFICANQVGEAMVKRGSDVNKITFVTPEGNEELPEMTKDQVGEAVGAKIATLLLKSKPVKPTDITDSSAGYAIGH